MIVDAYSILFLFTVGVLIVVLLGIFVQRQIFRMRNNSVRREASIVVGAGLSKRGKEELNRGIEMVRKFQLLRAPKFTEIGTITEHANAPYINRMIAMDELREIDRQLEFINSGLERLAGESTYAYLLRIREIALPSLSIQLIERIGSLAEHCRYRHEPFGEAELAETRALIMEIVKILNSEQERLSALNTKEVSSSLPATLHEFSKRLTSERKVRKKRMSLERKKLHDESKKDSGFTKKEEKINSLLPNQRSRGDNLKKPSIQSAATRYNSMDAKNSVPEESKPLLKIASKQVND